MAKKTKKTEEIIETANPVLVEDVEITPEETLEIAKEIGTGKSDEEILNELENKVKETLTPIEDLEQKVNDLVSKEVEINDIIVSNPGKAIEKINEELSKTSDLANEIRNEIKKARPHSKISTTNWWNGMGYDL